MKHIPANACGMLESHVASLSYTFSNMVAMNFCRPLLCLACSEEYFVSSIRLSSNQYRECCWLWLTNLEAFLLITGYLDVYEIRGTH